MNAQSISRRTLLKAAVVSGIAPVIGSARAQSSGKLLCTAPPGSIPDIIARRYAEAVARSQGPQWIVENRAGAAGQIAVGALRAAPADGSTLLLAQAAIATVYPYLYAKLQYDPDADLRPVALACETTTAFAIGPAVPQSVNTLAQFIDWAKANAAQASFASPGVGTQPHLIGVQMATQAKISLNHIAYPGGPPAIADVLGGRVASIALPEGLLRPHAAAGKLRLLATSGASRSGFTPDTPSFSELGFSGLDV